MTPKLPICCAPAAFDAMDSISNAMDANGALLKAAVSLSLQHGCYRVQDCDEQLESIAASISKRVHGAQSQGWFAHLHERLFAELAFAGNSEDYYNAENSLLPCVLETRLGLPITLSLVYKLVADKLGLGVWGVGLPGHFVAGTSMNGRLVFVDSFGGGRLLSVNDARTRVASQFGETIPWSDRLIEPVSNRYWVTRILQNLLSAYSRSGQFSELAAVLEMELILWPDEPRLQRDLALVLARVGKGASASEWLDYYLQNNPDDPQKDDLKQLITHDHR